MSWIAVAWLVFFLFLLVDSFSRVYVTRKYGADMVGSDLHSGLMLKWMWRLITIFAVLFMIGMIMFATVLFKGQGGYVLEGFGKFFGLFWDIAKLVVVDFFQTIF